MKVLAIIAEYNPYHNGHSYQIKQAKKQTGADYCIIVQSSSFTQRGEGAIASKWVRAHMALLDGADMVLELPALFSAASAEYFARGAVRLLHASGIVDTLCFGTETENLDTLSAIAGLLAEEPPAYKKKLTLFLSDGLSYPAAREKAVGALLTLDTASLRHPNSILAIEYLKALQYLKSSIYPVSIKRIQTGYHDTAVTGSIVSASAVRQQLAKGNTWILPAAIPAKALPPLICAIKKGAIQLSSQWISPLIQYKLRTLPLQKAVSLLDMEEGLYYRILEHAGTSYNLSALLESVQTRRFPKTRILRSLLHMLLEIDSDYAQFQHQQTLPPYLRVLGFRQESKILFTKMKKNAACPILTSLKQAPRLLSENGLALLELEKKATDLYAMGFLSDTQRKRNLDYTTPIVIPDKTSHIY